MEANSGLVVGSHNQNELVVIRQADGESVVSSITWQHVSVSICHICGDDVGLNVEGELFVACDECAFPICKTCYEHERSQGSQVCPQCNTRFKRLKGHARVEGDDEEDDIDDLENEFSHSSRHIELQELDHALAAGARLPGQMSCVAPNSSSNILQVVAKAIPLEHHALVPERYDNGLHPIGAYRDKQESWSEYDSKDCDINNDDALDSSLMGGPSRQSLSRKVPISSSQINPYRMIIIIRLVVLGFFFHYRITHPVYDAYALWLISVICEIWFALSWILDQFPKWLPVGRETYLDRLSLRYEKEGRPSELSPVDIFVSTVDPLKDSPLVTANTILSILAVDYPVDKVSCYVSDDGAAMLTFEALSETSEFARKWVPFCKKFNLEPRAPEWYFSHNIDYFKDKVLPSFVKERRAMKREYEEFKVRINSLVAKARTAPEEGWTMQDGSLWPGNDVRDHRGMIQVLPSHSTSGGHDNDYQNELPCLVYVSREKKPGFNHQEKAGAMNALVRVSGVLSNAPYLLNLDSGHYISNSKALREAMCFMMDPQLENRLCYVQFPHGIGIDNGDAKRNTVFCDNIKMKGLDGIQGPMCVGTGCVFRRQALYGYDAPRERKPATRTRGCCSASRSRSELEPTKGHSREGDPCANLQGMEKTFGQSPVFVASTLLGDGGIPLPATASLTTSNSRSLKEAIHVAGCGYEDKTEWGREVGWIYGSVAEDMLTGFKMHCNGWRSVYCNPTRPAFTAINLSDRLHQLFRLSLGSTQIFFTRHCPLWYGYGGGGLKWLQRLSYINSITSPWTSIPLLAYCTLPPLCLLTGKFIIPELGHVGSLWFLSLFLCILATSMLEMRWSGVGIDEWWRNEQFWLIGGVSAHLLAVFQGLLKVLVGVDTNLTVDNSNLPAIRRTTLLIPPATLLILNLIGVAAGVSIAIIKGYQSLAPLLAKLFFALWVIAHLYPSLKGQLDWQNKTPTIIIVWSILFASIFSLSWLSVDPFLRNLNGPVLEECGLECN